MRDEVYKSEKQIVDFAFSEEVADVFPDMIRRSIPGYETIIPLTGLIAAHHLGEAGTALDLGCSLGASTLSVLQQTTAANIRIVGVDSSEAMIARARDLVTDSRATFRCEDLTTIDVSDARVIICNFVLQFLDPGQRLPLLSRWRQQMAEDGMLVVSEKVSNSDSTVAGYFDDTHLAWKRANGYSELEVSQKRTALENVMKIDSETDHVERFTTAGFGNTIQWYRCLNWASFIVTP